MTLLADRGHGVLEAIGFLLQRRRSDWIALTELAYLGLDHRLE